MGKKIVPRMNGALVILLLLAGAGAGALPRPGGSPHSDESLDRGLAEVDSLLAVGQPALAARRVQTLLADHEGDPVHGWQLEERLGVALLRDGQAERALPYLEQAVRRNPTFGTGHRNLAAALMDLGRRGRALSEFRQAVELDPKNFDVRLEFGQVLLEFRNFREAELHLQTARALCPDCPGIRPALARLFLGTGEWDKAIEILLPLYRQTGNDEHRRALVQALQSAGRDSTLLELWSEIDLSRLPADEIRSLVEAEARMKIPVRSLDLARRLDGSEEPLRGIGTAGLELGRDARFWGSISLSLLQAGHLKEGLRAADRAVALAPDEVVYRNNRVVLLTKLGRHEEAAREWQEVLKRDPSLENRENR